jgi:hypothetical protein
MRAGERVENLARDLDRLDASALRGVHAPLFHLRLKRCGTA